MRSRQREAHQSSFQGLAVAGQIIAAVDEKNIPRGSKMSHSEVER